MTIKNSSIIFNHDKEKQELTVQIVGAMHFGQRKTFLVNLQGINSLVKSCIVDLSKTTHIDSTAIGMLLILKEHPQTQEASFTLKTCNNTTISKLLHSHNLDQLFKIA